MKNWWRTQFDVFANNYIIGRKKKTTIQSEDNSFRNSLLHLTIKPLYTYERNCLTLLCTIDIFAYCWNTWFILQSVYSYNSFRFSRYNGSLVLNSSPFFASIGGTSWLGLTPGIDGKKSVLNAGTCQMSGRRDCGGRRRCRSCRRSRYRGMFHG